MNMENAIQWFKWVVVATGTTITTILGGWDMALKALVFFVVCDYITGLVAAWKEKALDSNIGLYGIAKKIMLFIPIALGFWLDQILGSDILRSVAVFFYLGNEGLSILENLGRAGVPVPSVILDALQQLKNKGNKGG